MNLRRISTGLLTFAAVSGCASTPPAVGSGPQPNDPATSIAAGAGPTRWHGTLKATQQRTGTAAPTSQNKSTGSVFLTQAGADRTRVRMIVSTQVSSATALQWAILPGRCGSGTLPIAVVSSFPVIEISSNGRGELDMEMQLELPTSGTYHVNVYSGGTQLNNVITCGNLSRD